MRTFETKTVTRQFAAYFALVSAHYLLADLGELEAAKAAARGNMDSAITTFATLAEEIRCNRT